MAKGGKGERSEPARGDRASKAGTRTPRRGPSDIEQLNRCFLSFGPDSHANMNRLTALCGELLDASCALYNRLEGERLVSVGRWHAPAEFPEAGPAEGRICTDLIARGDPHPVVIPDLLDSPYAATDPGIHRHGWRTYVGLVVFCGGRPAGALCALFQDTRTTTEGDLILLGILASAVGVEEERLRANRALRESEHRYQRLFDTMGEVYYRLDLQGKVIHVSPSVERVLGMRPEEAMVEGFLSASIEVKTVQAFLSILQTRGHLEHFEAPFRRRDGSTAWVSVSGHLVRDPAGKAVEIEGVVADISDRKQIEAELRASEERLRSIFEAALDSIFIKDRERRYTYVNPSMERLLGIPTGEMVGKTDEELFGPESAGQAHEIDDLVLEGQVVEVDQTRTVRGVSLSLQIINVPLLDPGQEVVGLCGIARDITAHQQADEALRRSEARYRLLLENAPLGVLATDRAGNIVEVNQSLLKILGSPSAEATRAINVLTFPPLTAAGISEEFRRCLEQGVPVVAEHAYRSKWGAETYLRYHLRPMTDPDGTVSGVQGIAEDISESKRAEEDRVRLEEQLRQSQKMEAIGQLAGGVAHDMNNILGTVLGLASVVQTELDPEDPIAKDIRGIIEACKKGRDLTRNLLGFARKGRYLREKVSFNQVARDVATLLERTVSKKIAIHTDLDPVLAVVEGDPNQLNHSLMNICLNSVDAIADEGSIAIVTRNVVLPDPTIAVAPDLARGPYVRIRITDTGRGLDRATLEHVFEPFFTTKPVGEGTGLGLSMVYGTVKNHGGVVAMESEPGRGATVTILLPARATPLTTAALPATTATVRRRTAGTVLLVDDEKGFRDAAQKMLESLGFTVIVAEEGAGALRIYRERQGRIDLVILDLVMPIMDGEETFRHLRQIDPEVRVLLASGYSQEEQADALLSQGAAGFIQKPFDLDSLSEGIERTSLSRG